jgi:hypothetical protein
MSLARFILYDCLGVFFWVGAFVGLGYVFSNQIEQIAIYALRLGTSLILVILGGLAAYILWKYLDRRQFLKRLYMARVTPEELKQKLDVGEDLTIFDMRHSYEFETDPQTIPGAVHLSLEQLEKGDLGIIPRDREVILYCN